MVEYLFGFSYEVDVRFNIYVFVFKHNKWEMHEKCTTLNIKISLSILNNIIIGLFHRPSTRVIELNLI
jgi:hypothetical protein